MNVKDKKSGENPVTAIIIDDAGCLEIPLEVRQQLGITLAQSLNVEILDGCIILQPVSQEPKVRRQGTALVVETVPLGNLDTLMDNFLEEHIYSQM